MASSGMPRGQIGGALDLHIRQRATGLSSTVFRKVETMTPANVSTPASYSLMKGKFVPLQWRLAINKKAPASGNAGDLFVGYGKREDLGTDATLDRPGSDNLLTPTRQLPTGQGNIDYDPTTGTQDGQGPDGKANPRNIIESIPAGTTRVQSGHRFQKNIPLKLRLDGSAYLSASVSKHILGAIWATVKVGSTTLKPVSGSAMALANAVSGKAGSLEVSKLLESVFEVPNNIDLDTNAGTDVEVTIYFVNSGSYDNGPDIYRVLAELSEKGSVSATSAGPGGNKFTPTTDALTLNLVNTIVDLSQVSSGIDQVN